MPLLRQSGSDFTSFVKAAAQYVPSGGAAAKPSKSGGVVVAKPGLGAVIRTSQVGALASPTTSAVVINGVTPKAVAAPVVVAPSWVPTNPVTPLITWLDGTRGLTATTWSNYGTNGGSATISGATGLTTINSLGAINLGNGNMTIPQVLTAQGRAFFMVVKFNVAPTNGAQLIFQSPGFGQYDFSWRANNGLMMTNYGYANPYVAPPSSTDAVTPFIFGGVYSSVSTSSNAFYYNTTLQSPINANSVAANFTTGAINAYVNINNGGWGDPYVSMCICELLFYDGNLPLADAASAVSYLKAKWGTAT